MHRPPSTLSVQVYGYRDETFKHDASLVILLFHHSHFKPCIYFFFVKFASWHAYVLFFIDRLVLRIFFFYSHFLCVHKANHLPMCRVLCAVHSWALLNRVCPFFTTHHFVSVFLLVHKMHTRFIFKRCYCCAFVALFAFFSTFIIVYLLECDQCS